MYIVMDDHLNDEDVEFVVRPYQFEPQITNHAQDISSDDESSDESDCTELISTMYEVNIPQLL